MTFEIPPGEEFLKQHFDHQKDLYFRGKTYCSFFRKAIDIGAHIGLFSDKMVKDFDFVYAFEPIFYQYVEKNVHSNKIKIFPYGVSSTNSTLKFSINRRHTGMSKVDPFGNLDVECKVLDIFNFTEIDLIKIDAENHEYEILKGMNDFFKINSPVIIIEINQKRFIDPILSTLYNYGYEKMEKINNDFILKRKK